MNPDSGVESDTSQGGNFHKASCRYLKKRVFHMLCFFLVRLSVRS